MRTHQQEAGRKNQARPTANKQDQFRFESDQDERTGTRKARRGFTEGFDEENQQRGWEGGSDDMREVDEGRRMSDSQGYSTRQGQFEDDFDNDRGYATRTNSSRQSRDDWNDERGEGRSSNRDSDHFGQFDSDNRGYSSRQSDFDRDLERRGQQNRGHSQQDRFMGQDDERGYAPRQNRDEWHDERQVRGQMGREMQSRERDGQGRFRSEGDYRTGRDFQDDRNKPVSQNARNASPERRASSGRSLQNQQGRGTSSERLVASNRVSQNRKTPRSETIGRATSPRPQKNASGLQARGATKRITGGKRATGSTSRGRAKNSSTRSSRPSRP